ncbi:probable mitochondrial chaperone BCS1-B [Glycine max]|uniref:AAA+ ATPase domain-containing protein n=1 Tax=Glycine max TaxID=3847 RepID=C6TIP6_SOYBN|nr:probable mitochondrial chaperone BCS1-B [Glycine max]ACU22786.1 unknown [Glycine max]|eukprot:NP_001304357.1 probable mitochondrial chaperone BCS1-B [Glycine max]
MRTSLGSFSSPFTSFRSASSWFEVYAAFSTFMMLLRTAINDLIPHQVRAFIVTKIKALFSGRQNINQVSLQINEIWDGQINQLFQAAQEYLPAQISHSYKSLKVGKLPKHKNIAVAVDGTQEVVDLFQGIKLSWKLVEKSPKSDSDHRDHHPKSSGVGYERKSFTLSFDEKHRDVVMNKYINHVLSTYQDMQTEQKTIKIHSIGGRCWQKSDLTHPASFDSLALEPEQKQAIIDDLNRFLRRKELYKKVGKPWKRGYLLYEPPGTGKSSLIAAIANYLKFDVYDLELSSMFSNSELMRVMRETTNRSIIVIEDIDCNKEVHARPTTKPFSDSDSDFDRKRVKVKPYRFTLSGLLNNMDGLWSSGGEERIIIFTTNHRERIDPALLRPGRMDMHIHLSFLKGKAFRVLASNYLGIEDHSLFEEIDGLLEKLEVTPAVVAEQLMRNEDPEVALEGLVEFLKEKDKESLLRFMNETAD